MCVYCKAASAVLDALWDDYEFRAFFYDRHCELVGLGPLTHDVFVPAYLQVKRTLQGGPLELLEAQVAEDLLTPLYHRPEFREMWEALDQAAREVFLREQSEMKLARLVMVSCRGQLADAYKQAYRRHSDASSA